MNKTISAAPVNYDSNDINFVIDLPNKCPHCSVSFSQTPVTSYYAESQHYDYNAYASLICIYFCPCCEKFFTVLYFTTSLTERYPHGYIEKISPIPSTIAKFSDNISDLSPKFIEIFHQSEKAELAGLSELCGMGYRKALEFLVKDYAIKFNPDQTEEIKKNLLGNCINKYINHQRIKTLATASAWLGNDETHYVRKHEDYNLQHLKAFISSIVAYIDSELSFLEAEQLIATSKK